MKLMIATMIRGSRSSRSPSTRSWNGVVNASSSAAWTLIQLLSAIVVNCAQALAADRQRRAARGRSWPSGSPGRVKTSGQRGEQERQRRRTRRGPAGAGRGAADQDRRTTRQPGERERQERADRQQADRQDERDRERRT